MEIDFGAIYIYMFPYFIYPTTNIVLAFSIYLVLAIAFERFQAVCHPYYYRYVAHTQTVTFRVSKLTLPAFLAAVAINIPKFFETEIVEFSGPSTNLNTTHMIIKMTKLRLNPDYINYYVNWFCLFSTGLLPMLILTYFNISIYLKIADVGKRRTERLHQSLHRPSEERQQRLTVNTNCDNNEGIDTSNADTGCQLISKTSRHSAVNKLLLNPTIGKKDHHVMSGKDVRMAVTLLMIVIIFVVCHLPRVLLNLHEFFMVAQIIACGSSFCPPVWFLCAITFSHLLLVLNSSVNLLIYCSVGGVFKQNLLSKVQMCWHFIGKFCCPPYLSTRNKVDIIPMVLLDLPANVTARDVVVQEMANQVPQNCNEIETLDEVDDSGCN